jgi:hypothetical protein
MTDELLIGKDLEGNADLIEVLSENFLEGLRK